MYSKLILITALFFTTNAFAGKWFVGVNGGGNVTKSSPVGDLPMAREEFQVAAYKTSDRAEFESIIVSIVNQGKTYDEALAAASHLISLKMEYDIGTN